MVSSEKKKSRIKLVIIVLLSVAILLVAAYTFVEASAILQERNLLEQRSSAGASGIVVEPGLFNVKIVLPANIIVSLAGDAGRDTYLQNLEAAEGVKELTQNTDGSVNLTVTHDYHKQMAEDVRSDIIARLTALVQGNDAPSIHEAAFSNSLDLITIKVGSYAFENGDDELATVSIGVCALYYQALLGISDPQVEIQFLDVNNDTLIQSVLYPDSINQ